MVEELSRYHPQRHRDAEDELIREVARRAVRDFRLSALLPTAPGGMGMKAAERQARNRVFAELASHRPPRPTNCRHTPCRSSRASAPTTSHSA
ncbi:hypothetical protein GCM10010458_36740 [Microbacterium luteolum]